MSGFLGQPGQWNSTFSDQQIASQNRAASGLDFNSQNIRENPGYQTGLEYLMSMFSDPEFFAKFEAPIQRQYQEQTIPDLANRFAGMGSHGSFGTGFRNQLAREGSTLAEKLATIRGNLQQQSVPQLLNYAQQPTANFNQQYANINSQGQNNVYQPATAGFAGNVLGTAGGALLGNPALFNGLFNGGQGEVGQYGAGSGAGGLATGAALRGTQGLIPQS